MNIEIPSYKSLFVEMYFRDIRLSSGTATLVAKNRESHCTLITARHNVTGRHQDTGKCLSKLASVPDNMLVYFHESEEVGATQWKQVRLPLLKDDGSPNWFEHPGLGASADIVALNLNGGDDLVKYPYYPRRCFYRLAYHSEPSEYIDL